eukprot:1158044-Pelagomonas_calceolata.AAC.8
MTASMHTASMKAMYALHDISSNLTAHKEVSLRIDASWPSRESAGLRCDMENVVHVSLNHDQHASEHTG